MSDAKAVPVLRGLVLCGFIMMIEGYDIAAMALSVPHIAREWDVAAGSFGIPLAAVVIGHGLGAVLLAPFGDRRGRRPAIIVALTVMALTTLGTATAGSTTELAILRLVNGLGIGLCLPNATALIAELAPEGRWAGTLTVVFAGIAIGGIAPGCLRRGWWLAGAGASCSPALAWRCSYL